MAADPTIITENDIRLFLIDKTGERVKDWRRKKRGIRSAKIRAGPAFYEARYRHEVRAVMQDLRPAFQGGVAVGPMRQ